MRLVGTEAVALWVRSGSPGATAAWHPKPEDTDGALPLGALVDLDENSGVAHVQSGIALGRLERFVRSRGLSLGPLSADLCRTTVYDALAVGSTIRPSPRFGDLRSTVLAVTGVLHDGRVVRTEVAPRRATGSDLGRFLLGCGHRFGYLTEVYLRLSPLANHLFPVTVTGGPPSALLGVYSQLEDLGVRAATMTVGGSRDPSMHLTFVHEAERDLVAEVSRAAGVEATVGISLGTDRCSVDRPIAEALVPKPMIDAVLSRLKNGRVVGHVADRWIVFFEAAEGDAAVREPAWAASTEASDFSQLEAQLEVILGGR